MTLHCEHGCDYCLPMLVVESPTYATGKAIPMEHRTSRLPIPPPPIPRAKPAPLLVAPIPKSPLFEVSTDGKRWEVRDLGARFDGIRFLRRDGELVAVRNCRDVVTQKDEPGFDYQRRIVEKEAEDDAPIKMRPDYREPPMNVYAEAGAGIKARDLPPARPPLLFDDSILLADAGR